ncbi:hypothetical protein D920_00907, partial [Enterococcus faecalis 13-SD-W-01]
KKKRKTGKSVLRFFDVNQFDFRQKKSQALDKPDSLCLGRIRIS